MLVSFLFVNSQKYILKLRNQKSGSGFIILQTQRDSIYKNMSQKSSKRLLPVRQLSSSGSSVTSDFDRNSPSPASMLGTEEPHHYANPQELKNDVQLELDKIDGRKKKNLLYEQLPISEKQQQNGFHPRKHSIEHQSVYLQRHSYNDRLYRFLFVIIFLMSFGAFMLSILTSFGVISSCGGCKTGIL